MKKATEALTPEAIITYPSLFKPESYKLEEPVYKATLLISKDKDMEKLNDAMREATYHKWPNRDKEFYGKLRKPIRDGNSKAISKNGIVDKESFYFDHYFINVKSKYQPQIVNIYNDPITNEDEIYGGCIVKAYLSFYGYDFAGNFGIGAGLRAICKVRDGEPIGGGKIDTAEVFGNVIQERKAGFNTSGDLEDDIGW